MSDEPATPDPELPQDPGIPGWKPPPEGPEEERPSPPPDTGPPDADDEGHRA